MNQPIDNKQVNQLTDLFVMRGQAAAVNRCCRIYTRAIGRPRFIARRHYPGRFAGSLADLKELPQEYIDAKPVVEPGVALLSTH